MGRISSFADIAGVEQLFREFFRIPELGLAIYDSQLRYNALNASLAHMHRTPVESHLGKGMHEMLGPVGNMLEPQFRQVLSSGNPVLSYELAGVLPMREEAARWRNSIFPIKDMSGRVTQIASVVIELPKAAAPARTCHSPVLRSWKEIADYLGTCIKTVQRWEQAYAFPIRRLQQRKGATVFALKTEVDCWIAKRSHTRQTT